MTKAWEAVPRTETVLWLRLTFFKGSQLKDPKKLFNASLEGNALRAIDFHERDTLDEAGIEALILEAVRFNASKKREQ